MFCKENGHTNKIHHTSVTTNNPVALSDLPIWKNNFNCFSSPDDLTEPQNFDSGLCNTALFFTVTFWYATASMKNETKKHKKTFIAFSDSLVRSLSTSCLSLSARDEPFEIFSRYHREACSISKTHCR